MVLIQKVWTVPVWDTGRNWNTVQPQAGKTGRRWCRSGEPWSPGPPYARTVNKRVTERTWDWGRRTQRERMSGQQYSNMIHLISDRRHLRYSSSNACCCTAAPRFVFSPSKWYWHWWWFEATRQPDWEHAKHFRWENIKYFIKKIIFK